ncbi:laccase TilA [Exophiala viscosa]|uniref:laccase TilA n=1 Tax=Exophiala viscosa TaxID=2486360 RepID=UPI002197ECD2|nr:laccase TilA [Exophiala viscosa]
MGLSRFIHVLSFLSLAILTYASPLSIPTKRFNTSSTVQFEVTLTWEDYSPNGGTPRKMILTNGTFPGPPLKAQVGDCVEFLVHNQLPDETTIHFHGIVQQGTPWSDGVPGLSQRPIAPNSSFLYKWTADASGSYFYHAHYRSQIMDGLYGAIIISDNEASKPFSLISNDSSAIAAMEAAEKDQQTVFVADYYKYTSQELHEQEKAANIDFACADSILLNGMGAQWCLSRDEITAYTSPIVQGILSSASPPQLTNKGCLPPNLAAIQGNFTFDTAALPSNAYEECTASFGSMATFEVDQAKGYAAFTFINPGGFELLKFTIDGHKMWVYAVDGGYITPQLVDQVVINNGDRYSVLIPLDQTPAQYALRVANDGFNQIISGFGILNYTGSTGPANADPNALSAMNFAGTNLTDITIFDDDRAAPYPPSAPAPEADVTYAFNIKKMGQPYGAYQWTLGGLEAFNMSMEDSTPLLSENPASIDESDLIYKTTMGQWVDLIVQTDGPLAQPHPLHKHSNKAYVLGRGVGPWTWSSVSEAAIELPEGTFNLVNPPLRDGYTTTPIQGNSTWLALRYQVVNPGAFLFHCHIQTHMSGGMAVVLLDGVDAWPTMPVEYTSGNNGTLPSPPPALQKKVRMRARN